MRTQLTERQRIWQHHGTQRARPHLQVLVPRKVAEASLGVSVLGLEARQVAVFFRWEQRGRRLNASVGWQVNGQTLIRLALDDFLELLPWAPLAGVLDRRSLERQLLGHRDGVYRLVVCYAAALLGWRLCSGSRLFAGGSLLWETQPPAASHKCVLVRACWPPQHAQPTGTDVTHARTRVRVPAAREGDGAGGRRRDGGTHMHTQPRTCSHATTHPQPHARALRCRQTPACAAHSWRAARPGGEAPVQRDPLVLLVGAADIVHPDLLLLDLGYCRVPPLPLGQHLDGAPLCDLRARGSCQSSDTHTRRAGPAPLATAAPIPARHARRSGEAPTFTPSTVAMHVAPLTLLSLSPNPPLVYPLTAHEPFIQHLSHEPFIPEPRSPSHLKILESPRCTSSERPSPWRSSAPRAARRPFRPHRSPAG